MHEFLKRGHISINMSLRTETDKSLKKCMNGEKYRFFALFLMLRPFKYSLNKLKTHQQSSQTHSLYPFNNAIKLEVWKWQKKIINVYFR